MCDFYVIVLADASDSFAICGRYFCWNFSVFLSSFVNLSIVKAFPPSRTSAPNVSAWHQWDKIKSLTSELLVCFPCCHLKSFLLYFLFMCWSSTRRLCSVGGHTSRGEEQDISFWTRSPSWVASTSAVTLSWAMSSSGCCHLPGSLCDYSGSAESDASKESEESDSTTQAQYIAKVTAKDGRPLSTVVKAVSLQR